MIGFDGFGLFESDANIDAEGVAEVQAERAERESRDPLAGRIHAGTFRGACKDYGCDGSCRG